MVKFIGNFLKENFMYILVGALGTYVFMDVRESMEVRPTPVNMPSPKIEKGIDDYMQML